ncbi:MAG: RES family NAD+ phosphorylase [Terracidiphilus sp.]
MTTFWRISEHADLSGAGGRIGSARWHTKGTAVVYLADSPAAAMLERLVHLFDDEDGFLPSVYQLLEVSAPDEFAVKELLTIAPVDWREQPAFTRQLGNAWLHSKETPLAAVPSAIVPHTLNYLLNPEHPEANRIKINSATREGFDNRLFHFGAR